MRGQGIGQRTLRRRPAQLLCSQPNSRLRLRLEELYHQDTARMVTGVALIAGSPTVILASPDRELARRREHYDGARITIWDSEAAKASHFWALQEGVVEHIAVHPSKPQLALATGAGTLRMHRLLGETIRVIDVDDENEAGLLHCSFSPNGDLVAGCGYSGKGNIVAHGSSGPGSTSDASFSCAAADGSTEQTAWWCGFSPSGNAVLAATSDLYIRQVDGSANPFRFAVDSLVLDGAMHPGGQLLALACADGAVRLLNSDGTLNRQLRLHDEPISNCAFSSDGALLMSASVEDESVRLWELETERQLAEIAVPNLAKALLSPDDQLVTASDNGLLKGWQIARLVPTH